jgi:hypothetical protein
VRAQVQHDRDGEPHGRQAATGCAEIDADDVGVAILDPLRELDEVAYLRFASVYKSFDSLEDFEAAITLLRAEREPTGIEPPARVPLGTAGARTAQRPPTAAAESP